MRDPYEEALEHKLSELMQVGDMHAAKRVAEVLHEQKRKNRNMGVSGPAHTHSLGGAGGAGGVASHTHVSSVGGGAPGNMAQAVYRGPSYSLEQMMAMRMRWQEGALMPEGFAHMAMHQAGDVVHIWIITKDGQSLVLEDEAGLYPSDTLITKIRLLQRGE